MKNTMIGYYSGDEYGSDGWWEEGADSAETAQKCEVGATECGFDSAPELVDVEMGKLAELSEDRFDDLVSQWGLAYKNNWTSDEVDSAIRAEYNRRGQPGISGRAANRAL